MAQGIMYTGYSLNVHTDTHTMPNRQLYPTQGAKQNSGQSFMDSYQPMWLP